MRSVVAGKSAAVPWIDFVFLAAAGGVALHPLTLFWSANSDYFFGWAVPILAAYLFGERWRTRPGRQPAGAETRALTALLFWGAALLGTRAILETQPDWRPGLWLATGLYVGGALGWLWFYGGHEWVRHFWFPVVFLFLAVPWPFQWEVLFTQTLMRWNAALVAGSLTLADLPARAAGNTILLATGRLGVEEACSGIRSLQGALMISFFLGEFYRLAIKPRLILPLLAAGLAFAGNYARLLFLAWQGARHGVPAVASEHDTAGWAILCWTVLGLWAICLALPRTASLSSPSPSISIREGRLATTWAAGLLVAALLAEIGTRGWYAWRESGAPTAPAWSLILPRDAENFHVVPVAPVAHALLHDAEAQTGAWTDSRGWQWQALRFKYRLASTHGLIFDEHNPEICLPAAGLREAADYGEANRPVRGIPLHIHAYLFVSDRAADYVFWIVYLGRDLPAETNSPSALYGRSWPSFVARILAWGRDAWAGRRGFDAQTLEVAITGPDSFAGAQSAFAKFLNSAIVPDVGPSP